MIATLEATYEADGLTMVGHLAHPDGGGPWPAVLIGHDGVGLDDFQRRRADHLAEHAYVALAMEYHGGRCFFGDPEAMLARVLPMIADPGRMQALGRAALDVLLAEPGVDPARLAALGYGAGGSIVLELALAGAPFRGVAVVHPGPPSTRPEDPDLRSRPAPGLRPHAPGGRRRLAGGRLRRGRARLLGRADAPGRLPRRRTHPRPGHRARRPSPPRTH